MLQLLQTRQDILFGSAKRRFAGVLCWLQKLGAMAFLPTLRLSDICSMSRDDSAMFLRYLMALASMVHEGNWGKRSAQDLEGHVGVDEKSRTERCSAEERVYYVTIFACQS